METTAPRTSSGRPSTARAGLLAVSVALALAGCGDTEVETPASTSPSAGAVLPGGALTVAEAIETDAEPPLAVHGWVVRSGDDARLCSSYDGAAAEPCGEPSLALGGDDASAHGTEVSLLGAVDGERFVVSSTVQG